MARMKWNQLRARGFLAVQEKILLAMGLMLSVAFGSLHCAQADQIEAFCRQKCGEECRRIFPNDSANRYACQTTCVPRCVETARSSAGGREEQRPRPPIPREEYQHEGEQPDNVANWSGPWEKEEKEQVRNGFSAFEDEELADWVAANLQIQRKRDNTGLVTADGHSLKFKNLFFSQAPAYQENLVAFEAGKVFWNMMGSKSVGGGRSLRQWFTDYSYSHNSAISDMKAAKHSGRGLGHLGDFADPQSQFAYVFRAIALQLDEPEDASEEWDDVIGEVGKRIKPLLRRGNR